MKYLVTILLLLSAPLLFAEDQVKKITVGGKAISTEAQLDFSKLTYKSETTKDAIKKVELTSLSVTLDEKFSDTPFLYFFNGLIPKDTQDPRVWNIDGHYLNIVQKNGTISVNNLYNCDSLRLSAGGDYLVCANGRSARYINFDGTTRDTKSTGDVCPKEGGKSFTYGNCIMNVAQEGVRCNIEISWPDSSKAKLTKSCLTVEIQGEVLNCRRRKLKNSEKIDLSSYCFTDSSIMNSPDVFDRNRLDSNKALSVPSLLQGKEPPPVEGRSK